MASRIAIVQGHPDDAAGHFCHALAAAYAEGARAAGRDVREINVSRMALGYLRDQAEWRAPTDDGAVQAAQDALLWAEHLLIIYPLWLGDMPARLKSFFEHVSRGGFMIELGKDGSWQKKMTGRSARVVVTMGMPAAAYRWFYFSHSLRSLERNILKFAGFSPVRATLLGLVEGDSRATARAKWLDHMRELGRAGT